MTACEPYELLYCGHVECVCIGSSLRPWWSNISSYYIKVKNSVNIL